MSALYPLMDAFHAAILDKDAAAFAPKLQPNPRLSPEAQMAIYIEGYRLRLQETIASDYPQTMALLGQEAFDRLAYAFIETHPPCHFSLDHYPYPFASYVREHAGDPFAADLAALESAIAEVFLLEESEPLAATSLASLTPEAFGSMRLKPRTASRLLALHYPADDYLMQARKGEAATKPEATPSFLYVVRHENEVRRHALSEAEYHLLAQLAAGAPVGAALDNVTEASAQFLPDIAANLQSWFSRWTDNGFFQFAA